MSAFGIYVICLTVAYIIYYAVMIGMDLTAKDKNKNQEVMEIAVNGGVNDDDEEQPILVQMDSNSETGFSEGDKEEVNEETETMESSVVDEFDNDPELRKENATFGDPYEDEEKRAVAEDALFRDISEAVEDLSDIQRNYQYSYGSAAMQMALAKTDGIKVKVHSRKRQKGGEA
jgi:hypothetical protein